MPELICDTSALIALHQVSLLHILPALSSTVIVSAAVAQELAAGRSESDDLLDVADYDWMTIRSPTACLALPSRQQLGPGESHVLWLAFEIPGSVAILDDGPARRVAAQLGIAFTGTLGLLLDAKKRGLIAAVAPVLDELDRHAFNMSPRIRESILKAASETS